MTNGLTQIPIEERDPREVLTVRGKVDGRVVDVHIAPDHVTASNFGFDVTPRRLITGLITERGICRADQTELLKLFPEKQQI